MAVTKKTKNLFYMVQNVYYILPPEIGNGLFTRHWFYCLTAFIFFLICDSDFFLMNASMIICIIQM